MLEASVSVKQLGGPGAVIDVGSRSHVELDDRLSPAEIRNILAIAEAWAEIRYPSESEWKTAS